MSLTTRQREEPGLGSWLPLGICLGGFVLRVVFAGLLASQFWGRPDYRVDADTQAWRIAFENLWETGTYTAAPGTEHGYFGRMPGYSFFLGLFYLAGGKDWDRAYTLVSWAQVVLDSCAIYLVYGIARALFKDRRSPLVAAALYASYPFVIVWTPVVYSESLAVVWLLASGYAFVVGRGASWIAASGLLLGLAVLNRPQILLLAPLLGLASGFREPEGRARWAALASFAAGFCLAYGPWPLRNYVNHGQPVLTQDLRGFPTWSPDTLAFRQYIYSVKAEWEPQFGQILRNQEVDFPPAAYAVPGDAAKLATAVALAKTCGSGFSQWRGYWKQPFRTPDCNLEIARLFTELRQSQREHNPWNFWVAVPARNLQKALLKWRLYDRESLLRRMAEVLFVYRSFLILVGVAGAVRLLRSRETDRWFGAAALGFFVLLYLTLCAGTSPQMRNIEMRYFLPADVLLLIPAAGLASRMRFRAPRRRQAASDRSG